MIPSLIIIGSILIALFIMGNLLTSVFQHHFIFRGKPVPKNFDYQFNPNTEEFTYKTMDGGNVHAALFKVNPIQRTSKVVLFFHGNTGNLARWKNVAHQFNKRGYDVMIPDYRGYGKSNGARSENSFYADVLLIYDELCKEYIESKIIVYGKSIGTAAASYVAGKRSPLKVILETPFYSMVDLFYTYYRILPHWFKIKYPFENFKYLLQAKSPIHIIASGKDLVIPPKCSLKLKRILKPTDEFVWVEEGQHNDLAMYNIFQDFLDRNLV